MGYVPYNPNPKHKRKIDCTIRAICKATGQDWDTTFAGISVVAYDEKEMMVSDNVWGKYLLWKGFHRYVVPDDYGTDYTVETFSKDHPAGTYILAIDGHVVCVVDGDYYDFWDSGDCVPIYYWAKERL